MRTIQVASSTGIPAFESRLADIIPGFLRRRAFRSRGALEPSEEHRYAPMQLRRQHLAIVASRKRLSPGHARLDPGHSGQIEKMRRQRHLAPPTHVAARRISFGNAK